MESHFRVIAVNLVLGTLITLTAAVGLSGVTTGETKGSILSVYHNLPSIDSPQALATYDSELKPHVPIERAITARETQTYRIRLAAGQYINVLVQQLDVDVKIAAVDPGGNMVANKNWETRGSSESVWVRAETPGDYRLTVSAITSWENLRYVIELTKLGEFRTAPVSDRDIIEASEEYFDAERLSLQPDDASRKQAVVKLQQLLLRWRALDDRIGEGFTLKTLGRLYAITSDREKALAVYEEELQLWRAVKNHSGEEADSLSAMGVINHGFGRYVEAIANFNAAIEIRRRIGDSIGTASVLGDLAQAHYFHGDFQSALTANEEALRLRQAAGDIEGQARSLSNSSAIYSSLGEYQEALNYCKRALQLRRSAGDRRGEGVTLTNIGTNYRELGKPREALEYYKQALDLVDAQTSQTQKAALLDRMGRAYYDLGDYSRALESHQRSFVLIQPIADQFEKPTVLADIGNDYLRLGNGQKALEYFEQALKVYRDAGFQRGQALTLHYSGEAYLELGQLPKALSCFKDGLNLSRIIKSRFIEANLLYAIGRTEHLSGNDDEARRNVEAAIDIIESTRAKVASGDLKASFLASKQDLYELEIDLLMSSASHEQNQENVAKAFEFSERKRARSLLESLAETQTNIRAGVSPELVERARHLQQSLNAKAEQQVRLLGKKHTEEQVSSVSEEIERLTINYEQVLSQIRQSSPRYAALTQPVPLRLKQIQTQVLDSDSVLMEYSLGEERSYLWTVTPGSVSAYALPGRRSIEALGRQVYELLTARNQKVRFETADSKRARIALADDQYFQAALALSEMLLGPAKAHLKGKRLLIVADGVLDYIPFAALPSIDGNRDVSKTNWIPLVINHEIVSLPSVSTIGVLREEMAGRKPPSKTVAVLADAVFQPDDPRVKHDQKKTDARTIEVSDTVQEQTELLRSARDLGELEFQRLPYTRMEADRIVALETGSKKKESLDFEASRATAISPDLGDYRIIHFATHGFLNSEHPQLSGIVLSLVDQNGQPQDGFLRLNEIYDLKLNADLVVLSGCRTALGKEIRGEGLIGLTRGFMYAGAPRVLATVWSVEDSSTAELMNRFYRELLLNKQSTPAALRSAQAGIWRDSKLPPYYWAAFVLQGDWK